MNGVLYTFGRMFTYSALGTLFYFGASKFEIARALQSIGGVWLGVALVVFGILMLDVIKLPAVGGFGSRLQEKNLSK